MKKWLLPTVVLLWQATGYSQQTIADMPGKQIFDEAYRYLNGLGSSYDPVKAVQLFKKAADMGNAGALNALGNLFAQGQGNLQPDLNTAIKYYKQAGLAGYGNAYYNLASLYRDGKVLPQDFYQSAKYSIAGSEVGNNNCKNLLAYYYFKGFGVQQSYLESFKLYKELADIGDANAQYFTGLCYRNGYGVDADQNEAKRWLNLAASHGENQAVHELTAEPLPENSAIFNPASEQQVKELKKYEEKLITASSNDLSGDYAGFAVYYDFSNRFVHQIIPLSLTLKKVSGRYQGNWKEGDSLSATISATLNHNILSFDSGSQYTRRNYYSYGAEEKYAFEKVQLSIKYLKDSMYISGDMQFYSRSRKEPGQPIYIVLGKKVKAANNLLQNNLQLTINPNPASDEIKATFTLSKPSRIAFEISGIDGKSIAKQIHEALLPAGTYTYPINVQQLGKGSYTLLLKTDSGNNQTKIFIKL